MPRLPGSYSEYALRADFLANPRPRAARVEQHWSSLDFWFGKATMVANAPGKAGFKRGVFNDSRGRETEVAKILK